MLGLSDCLCMSFVEREIGILNMYVTKNDQFYGVIDCLGAKWLRIQTVHPII